jgi:uncharacterized protein (TIGR02271 family)
MTTSNDRWVVDPGTDVFGSDGTKIGSVDTIEGEYLVLRKGFFFPKDLYVPFSAISGHTDDRIDLSLTSDEVKNQDWSQGSTRTATTSTSSYDTTVVPQTTSTSYDTVGSTAAAMDEVDTTPFEHRTGGVAHSETDRDIVVPVVEEELTATKRGVERGAVRIETNVTEREQTLSVPVTEERIHIERVAVNRDATAADLDMESKTIEVPLYGEEVEMSKRARVVEEVEISKDAVQETRQVSGTVRREDVRVVDSTATSVESTTSGSSTTSRPDDPTTSRS